MQDKPRSGRPPVFDKKDKEGVRKLLEENNPMKYGINASFWDMKEFQRYFAKKGRDTYPGRR